MMDADDTVSTLNVTSADTAVGADADLGSTQLPSHLWYLPVRTVDTNDLASDGHAMRSVRCVTPGCPAAAVDMRGR